MEILGPIRAFDYFDAANKIVDILESEAPTAEKLAGINNSLTQLGTKIELLHQDGNGRKPIDRRGFMKFTGLFGVTLLIGLPDSQDTQYADHANLLSGDDEEDHGESGANEHHNPNLISTTDLISSAGVTAVFAGIVGAPFVNALAGAVVSDDMKSSQTYKQFEQMTNFPISSKTSAVMFAAWAAKMFFLDGDRRNNDPKHAEQSIASEHAYQHELQELKNVPIALALAAASEATSHLYLSDPRFVGDIEPQLLLEIFGGEGTITLADGTYIDVRRFVESITPDNAVYKALQTHKSQSGSDADFIKSETESSLEGKLRDIGNSEDQYKEFSRKFEEESGISLDEALQDSYHEYIDKVDTAHIIHYLYNYRNLHETREGNGIKGLIAGLEKSVTKKIAIMMGMGMSVAPLSFTFTSASLGNKQIPDIATDLIALKLAKSIDGDGEFDPYTQFEFIKEDVLKSQINGPSGLVNLAVAALANYDGMFFGDPPNIFYLINNGVSEWRKASWEGFQRSAAINALSINAYLAYVGINPVSHFGQEIEGLMQGGLIPFKTLAEVPLVKAGIMKISELIGSNTIPAGIREAIERKLNLSDVHSINFDTQGFLSHPSEKVQEFFYVNDLKNALNSFKKGMDLFTENPEIVLKGIDEKERQEAEEKLKSLDSLIKQYTFGDGKHLNLDDVMEIIQTDNAFELLKQVDQAYLKKYIQQVIDSRDSASKHDHGHGHHMSHAAMDVRNALLTQLWVIGSMQTVVKKKLGLDKEGTLSLDSIKEKTSILMGSIIGMSSVADNVAAMLFGISVLEDVVGKLIDQVDTTRLGDNKELFEADVAELKEIIRINAMLLAVFAGNLSLIGNGANMPIELVKDVIVRLFSKLENLSTLTEKELFEKLIEVENEMRKENEEYFVDVTREPNNLPRSVSNVPAVVSNLINFAVSQRQVFKEYDSFYEKYIAAAA